MLENVCAWQVLALWALEWASSVMGVRVGVELSVMGVRVGVASGEISLHTNAQTAASDSNQEYFIYILYTYFPTNLIYYNLLLYEQRV